MEDTLTLTQAHFSPAFRPHEEAAFVRQLISFTSGKNSKLRVIQQHDTLCTAELQQ